MAAKKKNQEQQTEIEMPTFESLLAVCAHLTKNGFKISKSKLYRDRDKGGYPDKSRRNRP